jgi:hypothetical protein
MCQTPGPVAGQDGPVFRIKLPVRVDDLDTNGHVRGPAYLGYADHARWECVWAAGIDPAQLRARNVGPVNLRTTIEFHRELFPHGLSRSAANSIGAKAKRPGSYRNSVLPTEPSSPLWKACQGCST